MNWSLVSGKVILPAEKGYENWMGSDNAIINIEDLVWGILNFHSLPLPDKCYKSGYRGLSTKYTNIFCIFISNAKMFE